jgi:PAS domain S-box-containing protein
MKIDHVMRGGLRPVKRGIYAVVLVSLAARELHYHFVRGVPLDENLVDLLIGMILASLLIEVSFWVVSGLMSQLQQEVSERQRAEQDLRRRTDQLEALRQVGLEVAAQLDPDMLLSSIVSRAIELLDGRWGGLFLIRPEGDLLERVVAVGQVSSSTSVLQRGEGLMGRVWESGEPLIVDDYQTLSGRMAREDEEHYAAVLGVPVRFGEEFLGVLNVSSDMPAAFVPADAEFLSLFSAQAAIAIKNAQLVKAEQIQLEWSEALATAAAVVNSALDIEQVLDRILEQVERVVAGDSFNVMLVEGDNFRIVRSRGYERMGISAPMIGKAIPISTYPNLIRMQQEGEPIVVSNTATSPDWIPADDREWRRSYLGAPIRSGGTVVGFLNVNGTQSGQFVAADAQRLSTFANYAATAIENARLVEGLEEEVAARTSEIRAEKEKSDTILRNVGDAITLTDLDLRIQFVNDAFLTLTGYSAEEVLGEDASKFGATVRSEQARESMLALLAQGKSWHGDALARRKDGRTYDAALVISPVQSAEGSLVGYVSSHRDISREKELERARQGFMASVSHELRTPVTNIKLYTQLLRRGQSPDKMARYLRVLDEQAERLSYLVEGVLEMTALDSGRALTTWELVSLSSVIGNVIEAYEDQAQTAGLTLEAQAIPPDLPAVVGDHVRIGQAMSKLVDNAIKFSPMGQEMDRSAPWRDRVTISVEAVEVDGQQWVTISVRDWGPGISSEDQDRVFERFFRGELAESGHVPGTGLGLNIANEIMRAHGGRMNFESKLGLGSTFSLWLPAVQE